MSRSRLLLFAALLVSGLAVARPGLAQNDAEFVSQNVPALLAPGETRSVSITMKNTGTTTWSRINDVYGYKLGTQNPQDNTLWTGGTRIRLPVGVQVAPWQTWTFTFNITAPTTPGSYNFQWRMVEELVQWFGDFTPNVVIKVENLCAGVPLPPAGTDAGPALQQCINNLPAGGTLPLPPVTYTIATQVKIAKPMTLRTTGSAGSTLSCESGFNCAVLKASANAAFDGILAVENTTDVTIDHIVLDGNRSARLNSTAANQCRSGFNRNGFNARMTNCRYCRFIYNVSRNALCGTALEYSGHDAVVVDNVFRANGQEYTAAEPNLVADGLTVHFSDRAAITDNTFVDNTGVALNVGGARNADILRNVVRQPGQVAYAGLLLFNFQNPNNSGDFTGTFVSGNDIHCGSMRRCHFGIALGPHPWNPALWIQGGTVTGNTVTYARQGINVEGAIQLVLYNNTASGSAPTSATFLCGTHATSDLNIYHSTVDRRGDTTPATARAWDNCP